MIVHILGSGSMFTKDTYSMISQYFNGKDDEHCFIGKFPDHDNFSGGGCRVIKSKSLKMIMTLNRADYIVVHGLINKLVVLVLAFQPWLLKKCNWIIWGGDIYIHEKKNKSLVEKGAETLKRYIAPRFPVITTLACGDYELACKWYGVKGKECSIVYPVPASNHELLEEIVREKKGDSSDVKIIVGNSATVTNQHFEVLDLLAKFKDENIRIYLPLNYGTGDFSAYAEKVIDYAKAIYGDKVEPLRQQLPGEEYLRFLGRMDVGIFNNNRQQAMGNISQLILCGSKVYLRSDTKMWGHFVQLGCELSDIKKIEQINSIDELVAQDSEVKRKNVAVIRGRHDMEHKVNQWQEMFATMRSICR